jgi:hypothetical protein
MTDQSKATDCQQPDSPQGLARRAIALAEQNARRSKASLRVDGERRP